MTEDEWLDLYYKMEASVRELDWNLSKWHLWFYSPTRALLRAEPLLAWAMNSGFRKGVRDAQAAFSVFGGQVHRDRSS